MTEASADVALNGETPLPLQYESLPPASRLEVREDAEGMTVVFRPVPLARVVAWTLGVAAALTLLLVLTATVAGVFMAWLNRGVPLGQAIVRLARIPPERWFALVRAVAGLPFGTAAGVIVLAALARLGAKGRIASLQMTRTGRIIYRMNPEYSFADWEADVRDVERVHARRRTLWIRRRSGTKIYLRGRPADLRWLAATMERYVREHTP